MTCFIILGLSKESSSGAACPHHICLRGVIYNFLEMHKKVASIVAATGVGVMCTSRKDITGKMQQHSM
jgi:hypothetical protein